jgi:hypothetical protein
MKEKQNSLNIESQEAKRDIYNVAVDLHPKTKEPIYIPNIQSVLRKGKTTKGNFFKAEPEWIDFEEDYIVERDEVNEIITNLENKKI